MVVSTLYGLNTPAAFAFVFNIIYTVYFASPPSSETLPSSSPHKVALAANFITGLISVFFWDSFGAILKVVPPARTTRADWWYWYCFLGLEQIVQYAAPVVGYSAIMWVFLGWYAGIKIGYGKYRCPEGPSWLSLSARPWLKRRA
jgi:AGZA family xanthine/uracil permease-like MFS transporter